MTRASSVEVGYVTRTAPRTTPLGRDGHGDVEQPRAERPRAPDARHRLPAQRGGDLRPRSRTSARVGVVGRESAMLAAAAVDDHDPAARVDCDSAAAMRCSAGERRTSRCRASSLSDAAAYASRAILAVRSCRSVRAFTIASGTSSATRTTIVNAR